MAKKKAEPQAAAKTVFVVMRDNWRHHGRWLRGEGQFRVAAFDSADQAEADRRRREDNARRRLNPFECGRELTELTSYPEGVLVDWVQDAGLTPPAAKRGKRDWEAWWDEVAPAAGPDQRAKVWEALDKLRFYHVVERPAFAVAYVAVAPIWEETAGNAILFDEGGEIVSVHRTRRPAYEVAQQSGYSYKGDRRSWFPVGRDPFDPETHWEQFLAGHATCDVVEVELEGVVTPRKSQTVFLVVRRTWNRHDGMGQHERVPVRGFADRAAAEACQRELEADFHRREELHQLIADWFEDEEALSEAAERLGIAAGEPRSWYERLTVEQRQALWPEVPGCFAYEVIETKLSD
jgi:hypothetical protein